MNIKLTGHVNDYNNMIEIAHQFSIVYTDVRHVSVVLIIKFAKGSARISFILSCIEVLIIISDYILQYPLDKIHQTNYILDTFTINIKFVF